MKMKGSVEKNTAFTLKLIERLTVKVGCFFCCCCATAAAPSQLAKGGFFLSAYVVKNQYSGGWFFNTNL